MANYHYEEYTTSFSSLVIGTTNTTNCKAILEPLDFIFTGWVRNPTFQDYVELFLTHLTRTRNKLLVK